ncbi:hypothetical protein AB0C52_36220 [Streptomyces sp. NPDC048717]|uniref:hypothetical protein n=1 Tax=Streptomyces sp. NPDC048717 TaxID=3154928 RepID=UPI003439FF4A
MTHQHWHAYAYTGRSYPDSAIRRGEVPADYPPIEIKDWLGRPRAQVRGTYAVVDDAVAWLESELTQNPPADEEHFPVWDRLQRSRQTLLLTAGNDMESTESREPAEYRRAPNPAQIAGGRFSEPMSRTIVSALSQRPTRVKPREE